VLKAWCLQSIEKIKDLKVKFVILEYFHTLMFMSINCNETIESFKAHGGEMVMKIFDSLKLDVPWMKYLWALLLPTWYIINSFPSIWYFVKIFKWMHYKLKVDFSH
jgi:hypothetical protein